MALGECQNAQRLPVAGARIAHDVRKAFDGFDVLGEYGQPGVEHRGHRFVVALEIGRQRLDRGLRTALVNGAYAGGIMPRSAIGEVIAVDRRKYDVRSEEHTSELQSLMRISYAVFCLKKK